ncbi:type I toxin-antitoxin system SymE family toxin [Pantoea stewartii]|uniref:type I toxin-antitoxin system SymE family toxin n=1 Tax=Pantoea stewartii TaxID=66269 RepID=UPI00138FC57F|nr:type I toxin-antitoxin system SymE family toxin [Pantoea stewartii]
MKITFISGPVPELTITGGQLAALGFTTDTPIRLVLRDNTLSVTVVTDEAEWKELCEASQQWQGLGADWVRENGEVIIGGSWLTGFGITDAEQLEMTAAPGVIRLQRR